MGKKGIYFLIVFIGLTCINLSSESLKGDEQEYLQRPETFFWVTLGGGIGSELAGKDGAFHLNQSFTIQQGMFNLTLRKYSMGQIMDEYAASEFALMLGLNKRFRRSILVFGLGPGKVFPDSSILERVIGLAFEGQIIWNFSKYFSVGLYIFGNVNKHKFASGLCLSLQLGKLR